MIKASFWKEAIQNGISMRNSGDLAQSSPCEHSISSRNIQDFQPRAMKWKLEAKEATSHRALVSTRQWLYVREG